MSLVTDSKLRLGPLPAQINKVLLMVDSEENNSEADLPFKKSDSAKSPNSCILRPKLSNGLRRHYSTHENLFINFISNPPAEALYSVVLPYSAVLPYSTVLPYTPVLPYYTVLPYSAVLPYYVVLPSYAVPPSSAVMPSSICSSFLF